MGMAAGRLLGNFANVLSDRYGYTINHWNVMETSCGCIGGFIFSIGMVGREHPEPPERENIPLASFYGIIYVLGIIPLWHRLNRIQPIAKKAEWAKALESYGYSDPAKLADVVLWLIDAVCVLGFVGAALWLVIHYRRMTRWSNAAGALAIRYDASLSEYQRALFALSRAAEVHQYASCLLGDVCSYGALCARRATAAGHRRFRRSRFRASLGFAGSDGCCGAAASLALVILLAGFVNNQKTMATANTRWPRWSWSDGPFPGRALRP